MYTLVMALAASLVMGNDPAAVSAETEQRLDLRGEWEGFMREAGHGLYRAWISNGVLTGRALNHPGVSITPLPVSRIVDERPGEVRLRWGARSQYLGIYEQEGERIVICYRHEQSGRPTSFRTGDGQHLLILHRVKPRK